MQPENPLVSIIVITYNSSEYILETLESAKAQTYQNIELIVSDDCSTDKTLEICSNWIEKNKDRFVRTELITVEKNTGISGNCNRGNKSAKGEWIKSIAGDDILCSNAIEEYARFVTENHYQICCAKLEYFGDDQTSIENTKKTYEQYFALLSKPLNKQQKLIIKQLFVPGPGVFHSKKLYDEVKGYDERFPMGEEWPFYLKVLEKGYSIILLDKELVKYRISNTSACRGHQFGVSKRVFDSSKDFFFKVRLKYMLRKLMLFKAWHETLNYSIMRLKHEEKSSIELFFFKSLYLLDPIALFSKCRKIFNL